MSDPFIKPPSKFIQIAMTSDPDVSVIVEGCEHYRAVGVRAMEGTRSWVRISSDRETPGARAAHIASLIKRPVEEKWGVVILNSTDNHYVWMQEDSEVWVGTKAEALVRSDEANTQYNRLQWLRCEARRIE
jgi:hypothetical protein